MKMSALKRQFQIALVAADAVGGGFGGPHMIDQSEMFLAASIFFGRWVGCSASLSHGLSFLAAP